MRPHLPEISSKPSVLNGFSEQVFALSLSAPFIPQFFQEPVDALTPYCDYIIGNEAEAESWATAHKLSNTKDIPLIAKTLAQTPKRNTARPRTVIITQGLEPSIVAVGKPDGEVEIKEFPVLPIAKEKICDTNGAGDAFAGGLMAGLVLGKTLDEAMHMGQWLAKLSIQELGPSYPFPKQTYTAYE